MLIKNGMLKYVPSGDHQSGLSCLYQELRRRRDAAFYTSNETQRYKASFIDASLLVALISLLIQKNSLFHGIGNLAESF